MVSIKSSSMVKPSQPTPNVKLYLPDSDQMKPYTHAPIFYVYHPTDCNKNIVSSPFETLKNALADALVWYYPLAGRLKWIGGGRFEIDCNEAGVEIVEAESEAEIKDLGDFRPSPETKKLIPAVDYSKDVTEWPIALVQFTRFKCGGVTIGTELSHIVVDGKSALAFISLWSKIARGDEVHDERPFLDRNVFYKGNPLAKPRFDHVEIKSSPLLIGHQDGEVERAKETRTAILTLSKFQVNKIKEAANEGRDNDKSISREYSKFEAISGHIMRCAAKARRLQTKQLTSVRIAVDVRKRLQPPLPQGYFGNAVFVTVVVTEAGELLLNSLGYACRKIRESVEKVTDEYIRSTMDYLSSQEDINSVRTGFHSVNVKGRHFLGNPNLNITTWFGLPIDDANFGWGKPIFMGPAELGFDGRIFIFPSSVEDGAMVTAIRLQVAHMDAFEKFFYEDLPSVVQEPENGSA